LERHCTLLRKSATFAHNPPVDSTSLIETSPRSRGHGGAREGAGRPPGGYKKPPKSEAELDFDKERALHEKVKRERAELAYMVDSGRYVARDAVQQASATTVAALAQTLRSIPDNLERKGIAPEVCALIERQIDEAMREAALQMQLMAGTPIGETQ
jgi:hypothetical protein